MGRALYSAIFAALFVTACTGKSDRVWLDLGDAEDYQAFLTARGDDEKPEPFTPEPLFVSATGKVQAKPDIAVITATITAVDKNESRAVNEMGQIINAVQTTLKDRKIEVGFTGVNSSREFDEACQNENRFAQQRHNEIRDDYYFNKRLDDRGDTEIKRRDPKPRVAQQTCFAQKIKVSTNMVIRIQPADAAGDVLRALSDAGAENSRLFGYDFADYDALYQKASAKAVTLAREKAETVARLAGGTLGEIESFAVSAPERRGRFGPQPNIIRPANRYPTPRGSAIDRQIDANKRNRNGRYQAAPPPPPPPSPVAAPIYADEVIATAGKRAYVPGELPPNASLAGESFRKCKDGRWVSTKKDCLLEGTISSQVSSGGRGNTNALSISLLSGPQTISATANLGYTYETPLNGKIIVEPEDDN